MACFYFLKVLYDKEITAVMQPDIDYHVSAAAVLHEELGVLMQVSCETRALITVKILRTVQLINQQDYFFKDSVATLSRISKQRLNINTYQY